MYCQYPKIISTHTPKREHEAPASPRNASLVSKLSQTKLFQKIRKTLTCPLLLFSRHVTQIPTSRRHLPQGPACAGPRTSLLCLSQRLAACFLQFIWSDRQRQVQALGPEVFDTAHTTHIRGLAAFQNK